MKTKLFKQVYRAPTGYFFRITLPVAKFQTEERWEQAQDCAFFADLFKLLLVRRYKLSGNTMFPSLDPAVFSEMLGSIGADRSSSDSLFDALPASCRDFLTDGGNEMLLEHVARRPAMNKAVS